MKCEEIFMPLLKVPVYFQSFGMIHSENEDK